MQDGYKYNSDFRLVQHLSGACRAARASMRGDFPAARLLMSLDDVDIAHCRRRRSSRIPLLFFFCLATPIFLSFLGEVGGDFGLGCIINFIWIGWLMFQNAMMSYSPWLFSFFWIFVILYALHTFHALDEIEKELMIYREVKFTVRMAQRAKSLSNAIWSWMSRRRIYNFLKTIACIIVRKRPMSV